LLAHGSRGPFEDPCSAQPLHRLLKHEAFFITRQGGHTNLSKDDTKAVKRKPVHYWKWCWAVKEDFSTSIPPSHVFIRSFLGLSL